MHAPRRRGGRCGWITIHGRGPAGVAGPSLCLRPHEEDEMRRTSSTCRRMVLMGFGVLSAAALCTSPVFGQLPQPLIPDIHERSGLLDRFIPIEPHLPPDKDRDN